jgi:penicillin-binding protein 1A
MDKVGPEAVVKLTHIREEIWNTYSTSIALGAVDITVEDMVAAYGTFANQGVYTKPQFLSRIEDKSGVIMMNQYLNHMMCWTRTLPLPLLNY